MFSAFDFMRFESFGWMDSPEDHREKVEAVHDDMQHFSGAKSPLMLDEFLHHHNLEYDTLTEDELHYIFGDGDTEQTFIKIFDII